MRKNNFSTKEELNNIWGMAKNPEGTKEFADFVREISKKSGTIVSTADAIDFTTMLLSAIAFKQVCTEVQCSRENNNLERAKEALERASDIMFGMNIIKPVLDMFSEGERNNEMEIREIRESVNEVNEKLDKLYELIEERTTVVVRDTKEK